MLFFFKDPSYSKSILTHTNKAKKNKKTILQFINVVSFTHNKLGHTEPCGGSDLASRPHFGQPSATWWYMDLSSLKIGYWNQLLYSLLWPLYKPKSFLKLNVNMADRMSESPRNSQKYRKPLICKNQLEHHEIRSFSSIKTITAQWIAEFAQRAFPH